MKIYRFPEPVLREQAEPVEGIDDELQYVFSTVGVDKIPEFLENR